MDEVEIAFDKWWPTRAITTTPELNGFRAGWEYAMQYISKQIGDSEAEALAKWNKRTYGEKLQITSTSSSSWSFLYGKYR